VAIGVIAAPPGSVEFGASVAFVSSDASLDAIFKAYDVRGLYPEEISEDLVRRIGRARLTMLPARAVTSADKYRRDGYGRRARRNLALLARYLLGADPADLAKRYD
jgi:hypothetical protein